MTDSATHPGSSLKLRRAGPDDDQAMRALVAASFPSNPKVRADMTRWQWWENPFGETLAWVWEDAGDIVAQYVAFCAPGWIAGRRTTVTLGVDAAVAPDYQGRRLFSPLSEALYADSISRGWPLYAYPNEQSWKGISRAGWIEVSTPAIYVLIRPGGARWLTSRLKLPAAMSPVTGLAAGVAFRPRKPKGGSHVAAVLSSSPPDGIEELWKAVASAEESGLARGADWWRWRYDAHPDKPYRFIEVRHDGQLVGTAAVVIREELGGRFVCLLELLARDYDAARAIVVAISDGAVGDSDGIALTATRGSRLESLARATGLRRVPRRFQHRPIRFGVVPEPDVVPDPTALRWATSWGDLDHT